MFGVDERSVWLEWEKCWAGMRWSGMREVLGWNERSVGAGMRNKVLGGVGEVFGVE